MSFQVTLGDLLVILTVFMSVGSNWQKMRQLIDTVKHHIEVEHPADELKWQQALTGIVNKVDDIDRRVVHLEAKQT